MNSSSRRSSSGERGHGKVSSLFLLGSLSNSTRQTWTEYGLFEAWSIRILNPGARSSHEGQANRPDARPRPAGTEDAVFERERLEPELKEHVMTLAKSLLGIAVLVTVLSIPGSAAAQTCVSDSDCAKGLTCQASADAVTPTPTCPVGADCPKTVPLPAPSMTCQPAPCQTDADCGQGMVCHSQTSTMCSGGTAVVVKCDPNTVCDPAPPATDPVCTTTTTSQCIYRWQLPCNADTDCGDGFACQPTTMGMCSGSGSASSGSGSSSSGSGGGSGSGGLAFPPSSPVPDG